LATIIAKDMAFGHSVNKYNFKVLSMNGSSSTPSQDREKDNAEIAVKSEEHAVKDTKVDSSALSQNSKDSLIESLMKKTDEMSSNFIKLQMKLEDKELEHEAELKRVKEEAFNEGIKEGKVQASKEGDTSYKNGLSQFSASITSLEKSAKDYEIALEGIKSQLVTAAIDISKEVIDIEVSQSSQKIAKVLSDELIKELQSASKITLKVNPKDHGPLSEHVGSLKHIEVVSDSAVSVGGVIAISDAGNIDAQISKRFERVKRAALSE
jgi:flagellar assembly protein FliH